MKKIREFAKLCGTSAKTLRFYDKIGVLEAKYTDPDNGYRYYDDGQEGIYARIRTLQTIGFTLDEIKHDLTGVSEERILEALRRKERELQQACALCADQIHYYDKLVRCRQEYESGKTYVRRLGEENRIVVFNRETSLTFSVRAEAMEVCFHALYKMFAEPASVGISLDDVPKFTGEERPAFVQSIYGDAEELLSTEPEAFFSESDKIAAIKNVIFYIELGTIENFTLDEQVTLIDKLSCRLASCFPSNSCIIWGTDFNPERQKNSVGITIIGIY